MPLRLGVDESFVLRCCAVPGLCRVLRCCKVLHAPASCRLQHVAAATAAQHEFCHLYIPGPCSSMAGPATSCKKHTGHGWVAKTQQDFKQHCMDQAREGHSSAAKTYLHPDAWTGHWNQSLRRSLEILGFSSVIVQSQRSLSSSGWKNQTLVCACWLQDTCPSQLCVIFVT